MQNPRPSTRISFVLALLATAVGCGQFFPGANSITALSVAPASATVQPGVTQQYTATATYGNNTTGDVTTQVTWSTTPTNVATITSGGLLTAVSFGYRYRPGAERRCNSQHSCDRDPEAGLQHHYLSAEPDPSEFVARTDDGSVHRDRNLQRRVDRQRNQHRHLDFGSQFGRHHFLDRSGHGCGHGNANITATSGGVTSNTATVTVVQ